MSNPRNTGLNPLLARQQPAHVRRQQQMQQQQSGRQTAEQAKKKLEADINRLTQKVNRFRIDAQRFVAGDLELPPEDLREEIQRELRRLQQDKSSGTGDLFRLNTLESQFASHQALFDRRLRERDTKRRAQHEEQKKKLDARAGVVLGAEVERDAVEALYKSMYMSGPGQPKVDLERFQSHLSKQVQTLRAKTGAEKIQFRVAEENGKLKIKAKPVRD